MGTNTVDLLVLRLTNDCNLKCKYCYANGGEKKEYMNKEIAFKAIDYVGKKNKNFTVQLTGGEPLLALDLIQEIYRYGRDQGYIIKYQMQTNGLLIDKKTAVKLKEMKIALGLSLDGLPNVNDTLRIRHGGSGSAVDVCKSINVLKQEGMMINLTATVTNKNINHLAELVDLASYLGNVYGVSFDLFRPMGRGINSNLEVTDFELLQKEILRALRRAEEIKALGGSTIHFKDLDRIRYQLKTGYKREKYCHAVTGRSFVVKPGGEVYPCSSFADYPEFRLGNILEDNFSPFGRMEEFAEASKIVNAGCQNCEDKWLCGGGCIARSYAYYGKVNQVYKGECILRKTFINYARNS